MLCFIETGLIKLFCFFVYKKQKQTFILKYQGT